MSEILIISLDTPYPDNYGGTKDIWQRLKVLKDAGHRLHLIASCKDEMRRKIFESHAEVQSIFASTVIVPTRGFSSVLSLYPIGVAARQLSAAQVRTLGDTFRKVEFDVVEIEGLQSLQTFCVLRTVIKFKRAYVRAFNRESAYQRNQAKSEKNYLRKVVFYIDAVKFWLFERYGSWKDSVDAVLFISKDEIGHRNFRGSLQQHLIPPLFSDEYPALLLNDFQKRENLFLYVGNLRLADNQAAARNAFDTLLPILERHNWSFAICGLSQDPNVLSDLQKHPNVVCEFNLSAEALAAMYLRAKIFVCFSENPAGVKLKLIEALKVGLPIVANQAAITGSQLEDAVVLLDKQVGESNPSLEGIMACKNKWQDQRLRGYSKWQNLNSVSRSKYLELFSFA